MESFQEIIVEMTPPRNESSNGLISTKAGYYAVIAEYRKIETRSGSADPDRTELASGLFQ